MSCAGPRDRRIRRLWPRSRSAAVHTRRRAFGASRRSVAGEYEDAGADLLDQPVVQLRCLVQQRGAEVLGAGHRRGGSPLDEVAGAAVEPVALVAVRRVFDGGDLDLLGGERPKSVIADARVVVQGDLTFDAAAVSSGGGHSPTLRLDRPTRSRPSRRRPPTGDDPVHPRPASARERGADEGVKMGCQSSGVPGPDRSSPSVARQEEPTTTGWLPSPTSQSAPRGSTGPVSAPPAPSSRDPGPEQD
jgi:hypothetical protein